MTNSYHQQKKALLIATLLSLAMHGVIISALSGAGKGEKIRLRKNTIKINLVEIKTKQESIVPKPMPKEQLSNQKKPQAIRQLKSRVNKQNESQKTKGEPAKRKRSPKPEPSVDTGSQTSKEPAVAATDTSNTNDSESVSESTSPSSSKESTSIIPKETPRCRLCLEPEKPQRLVKRGIESYAIFKLYISASGKVLKTELLNSSGHTSFINSSRKAAMSSTFYPMAQQNTLDIFYEMNIEKK